MSEQTYLWKQLVEAYYKGYDRGRVGTAPEILEESAPSASSNKQSIKCCCFLSDIPHHRYIVGGRVKSVSLSLEVNKECPVHGHNFL